jgi:hypothetical protein
MSNQQIIEKIEEIYTSKDKNGNQTGKNFISHLVRSYMPTSKVEKSTTSAGKKMRCAITGRKLFSLSDVENTINSDEFMSDFQKNILYTLNPENNNKGQDHPIKKFVNGKQLGITGNKTNTFLCIEAYEELTNWVFDKIVKGDKHLEWVVRDMGNKQLIQHLNDLLPKPEKKDNKKFNKDNKKAAPRIYTTQTAASKSTLGDLSALQELKKKLEAGN